MPIFYRRIGLAQALAVGIFKERVRTIYVKTRCAFRRACADFCTICHILSNEWRHPRAQWASKRKAREQVAARREGTRSSCTTRRRCGYGNSRKRLKIYWRCGYRKRNAVNCFRWGQVHQNRLSQVGESRLGEAMPRFHDPHQRQARKMRKKMHPLQFS